MKARLFRLRRAVGVQFTGVCILLMFGMGGLAPAWGQDKAGALMSIAAESTAPVKYSLDEKNGTISWMSGEFKPAGRTRPVRIAPAFGICGSPAPGTR